MTPPQPTAAVLRKTILAGLVGALLLAAPAHAAVGVQDDEALKYNTAGFLARADQLGADWVRIMVPYGRWQGGEDDAYVHAAQAAHDSGRRVMVSLVSWFDYPTPDQWTGYAQEVVPRLAPYVDAWSVMNEPNWPGMAPRTQTRCVPVTGVSTTPQSSAIRSGTRVSHRWKRVRRGKGRYLRHRVRHHWRYTRARTHRQHHRARWRRVTVRKVLFRQRVDYVTTRSEMRQCTTEALALAYRRVYDRVAPLFRSDDGALIVVGDLCPCGTSTESTAGFMDAFYSAGPPDVQPDVLGIHPYDGVSAAADAVDYGRAHGLPTWATEWGAHAPSTVSDWTTSLAAFERVGVRRTFLYDTGSDVGWDTRVPVGALESIAAMP